MKGIVYLLMVQVAVADLSDIEEAFCDAVSPKTTRSNLRFITSIPHVAGTAGDQVMANFVLDHFRQSGIPDVSMFDLQVKLNYPEKKPEAILYHEDDVAFRARFSEEILPEDDTSDTFWRNHTFHGYSPSGTVEKASFVYANYGRPEDFDSLANAGVSVKNKIVIVRYGKCFRGLKVKNSQVRGALGVIIYSDPADDGYGVGPVYPVGPWRSPSSVQRGSVQFNSQCAGDPWRLDPRYGNQSAMEVCGVSSVTELVPSIPSIPMSYGDVKPILENIGGPGAFQVGGSEFVGGIRGLEYRVGPSTNYSLSLRVRNFWKNTSIPNVVGKIPGTLPEEKDMPILLGNHRDAWVFGAADPNSGTAALMEVAKGLGTLWRNGWRPARSIYLLSWSGEEYGLVGSTGWAELNQGLINRAVAYLNVDTVVSGNHLSVSASPSLISLWKDVVAGLGSSREHSMAFANEPFGEVRDANTNRLLSDEQKIGILGSGSDYTVFLDHFGIPSLDFSFGKGGGHTYGQYHSIYDSFSWIDKFGGAPGKPGSSFDLMAFSAKIWGILAIRLSDNPVIPLSSVLLGEALSEYTSLFVHQNTGLDLSDLQAAAKKFQKSAAALQLECSVVARNTRVGSPYLRSSTCDAADCNDKLGLMERGFLLEDGLPGRPWFRHVLQAPGMDLGYAAQAFPSMQQAIDNGNFDEAQDQTDKIASLISEAANRLNPSSR